MKHDIRWLAGLLEGEGKLMRKLLPYLGARRSARVAEILGEYY